MSQTNSTTDSTTGSTIASITTQSISVISSNTAPNVGTTIPTANTVSTDATSVAGTQPAAATINTAQLVKLISAIQSGQNSGPKHHKPKQPDSYDGKYDIDAENHMSAASWVKQVNRYFVQCSGVWTDELKIDTLISFTTGIAANRCERWLVEKGE